MSSRKEMQEKLNKQYIDQKINPIVEPMTIAIFNNIDEFEKNPVSVKFQV